MLAFGLDALEGRQNVHRFQVRNRLPRNGRELFQKPIGFRGRRIGAALRNHLVDILLGDIAEGVRRVVKREQLLPLTVGHRISALVQLASRFVALSTSFSEANIRIAAKRDPLVLTEVPVLQAP